MGIRTFLAVELDEATRARLAEAAAGVDTRRARVRLVSAENLHVTLNFLGDVADPQVPAVCEAARRVAAAAEPFQFAVRGLLAVPPRGATLRMLWAGVDDSSGGMAALQAALTAALAELGFGPDRRPFRPHLTLARFKSPPGQRGATADAGAIRAAVADRADEPFGAVAAEAVTVFSSTLGPGGPTYAPLDRCPLGTAEHG